MVSPKKYDVPDIQKRINSHISVLLRSNSGAVPIVDKSYRIRISKNRLLEGVTDKDGLIYHQNVPPGDYTVEMDGFQEGFIVPTLPKHIERQILIVPEYFLFEEKSYEDMDLLSTDEDELIIFDQPEADEE